MGKMQGEALVMGYDEMGWVDSRIAALIESDSDTMTYGCLMLAETLCFRYELWKPYLRSMMEADMKSVSIGTKSKSEVLESCLQQMKACFLDVSCEFLVFHDTYPNIVILKPWQNKKWRKATLLSLLYLATVSLNVYTVIWLHDGRWFNAGKGEQSEAPWCNGDILCKVFDFGH